MKLCRFNDKGIAAVRELLPQIKTVDDLARAEALVSTADLFEPIPALADIDLDASRIFPTTFAFCEYFHTLMKDHRPLDYRTDVGFWTWLAMVYVRQLVKIDGEKIDTGDASRLIYIPMVYGKSHRHLLASPFYLFAMYPDNPKLTEVPLLHSPSSPGDIFENIVARQVISQNPAFLRAIRLLYLNEKTRSIRPKVAGPGQKGGIRRFTDIVDQFGMTRDFCRQEDALEFIKILPQEFDPFKASED